MKILLQNTKIVGINPTAIIDKDGSVIKDYATNMLKDGPAWDRLDEMLGE